MVGDATLFVIKLINYVNTKLGACLLLGPVSAYWDEDDQDSNNDTHYFITLETVFPQKIL